MIIDTIFAFVFIIAHIHALQLTYEIIRCFMEGNLPIKNLINLIILVVYTFKFVRYVELRQ